MDIFFHHISLGTQRAQVSDEDADLAEMRWHLAGGKKAAGLYASTHLYLPDRQDSHTAYLHRIVAQRMGLLPEAVGSDGVRWRQSIDHINGDKLDNRRENLRLCNRKEQMTNPANRLRRTNTSGVRGVSYIQSTRRWYASVMVDGKTRSLGHYQTKEEAAAARQEWDRAH